MAGAPSALCQAGKKPAVIGSGSHLTYDLEAHRLDSRCMEYRGRSAGAREGGTAFLEERPPRFAMRLSADMPPFYPWRVSGPFAP